MYHPTQLIDFSTLLGREVSILVANVLKLLCGRIQYLNIAGQISVSVHLCKLIKMLIGNLSHV